VRLLDAKAGLGQPFSEHDSPVTVVFDQQHKRPLG
jgi:hypothetical protein